MDNNDIIKENKGKKFDVVLMNPPYGTKGDTIANKFFNKCINLCEKIVSIQPATFIVKSKLTRNVKNEKETLDFFNKYYSNIELFDKTTFDIRTNQKIAIIYVDKSKDQKIIFKNEFGEKEYKDYNKINKYNDNIYIKEFKEIVDNLCKINGLFYNHVICTDPRDIKSSNIKKNDENSNLYFINIPYIHGIPGYDDMYTILNKTTNILLTGRGRNYINFNNKNECQNCINYLKTDFVRMCIWFLKNDSALIYNLKNIPWFDFSDEHFSKSSREIDDWLFKKYNISDEIRKHIEEILPDYYGIRKQI